jgi:hypothetical protein
MPRVLKRTRQSLTVAERKVTNETSAYLTKEFKVQGKLTNAFLFEEGIHQWLYADAQSQIEREQEAQKRSLVEETFVEKKIQPPEAELERQTKKWYEATKPSHDRMAEKLGRQNIKGGKIGGQKGLAGLGYPKVDFNLKDPKLIKALLKRGEKITGVISKNTLERFQNILVKGYYELGEDPRTVAKIIDDLFTETYKGRAWTIAKTETAIAVSSVQNITYKENNVKTRSWLAVGDGRTRESHMDFMNNQSPRKIDVPFRNKKTGETIMFPHDPAGPAEEVINCRCDETVQEFYKGGRPDKKDLWAGF